MAAAQKGKIEKEGKREPYSLTELGWHAQQWRAASSHMGDGREVFRERVGLLRAWVKVYRGFDQHLKEKDRSN